jgi:hypothetical protein
MFKQMMREKRCVGKFRLILKLENLDTYVIKEITEKNSPELSII